jgi:hypothetical protein
MKNNSFDNSIKQKLEGHEAPVPADAWANIQKGKKRRRPWIFFWLLGGLLLCGGTAVFFLNDKNNQKDALPVTVNKGNTLIDANQKLPASNGLNNKLSSDTNNITTDYAISNDITANDQSDKKTTANAIIATNENVNTVGIRSGDAIAKRSSFKNKKDNKDLVKIKDADDADETLSTGKKVISNTAGRFKMTIKAAEAEEENLAVNDIGKSDPAEMTASAEDILKDSIPVNFLSGELEKDSLPLAAAKQQAGKKMPKPGISIAFSLSPFSPLSNFDQPISIQRTIETSMNKAEFTATDISIRRQTSISFSALIKKGISAKAQAGAGLSYTVIKEYIKLKGEETNTVLSVVKRLQNGNQLVNDTISVTSTGIRSIDAVNSYNFLSIPLSIQYQLSGSNGWELALQAGLDINLSSKYRNEIAGKLVPRYAPGNSAPVKNKSMGIGFNTGLYIGRGLGKRYIIFAAPYLQLNPTKIYLQGMPAGGKINRAGIGWGINYRF